MCIRDSAGRFPLRYGAGSDFISNCTACGPLFKRVLFASGLPRLFDGAWIKARFGRGYLGKRNNGCLLPNEMCIRDRFNPSPFDEEVLSLPLHLVDWFFVNEIEGAALSGESDPERILDGIRTRYPKSKTVLTLGKNGSMADDGKERAFHDIFHTEVVDTTAAGDTFTGFFIAAVSAGKPIKQALREASAAAALAVSAKGASVSIPERKTVEAFLDDSKTAY